MATSKAAAVLRKLFRGITEFKDVLGDEPWDPNRAYFKIQRSGLQGLGNSMIDRGVEQSLFYTKSLSMIEIGASSGEHLDFVNDLSLIKRYVALDLFPRVTNPALSFQLETLIPIEFVQGDAEKLPFSDNEFDVALSMCVLAHVNNPETVLQELRRVTRGGGQIAIGMPCDPGMINRLIKGLVTYRVMRRNGVENPKLSYARDHRNAIGNLIELTRHVFYEDKLRISYRPFRLRSWNLNLFCVIKVDIKK